MYDSITINIYYHASKDNSYIEYFVYADEIINNKYLNTFIIDNDINLFKLIKRILLYILKLLENNNSNIDINIDICLPKIINNENVINKTKEIYNKLENKFKNKHKLNIHID